ncbi:Acetyltransferase (GNAT) domain-containing protein [Filimonas lacunae]|uniref:Acetyltransferase (GNAT) domain-containing protein n=1 Tax=Filimonas lacunae TaxID=477680 RepID=A0A173MNE1_9BACT|nr:GNAT family N-acetyltransferase [Filimonas lacunae]BAV09006.1 acetyltransferase, GNAT family [Filimonas lacunae]SIS65681.1 Acetyltransferase (GNAT) domain-containing protein [Filimonas lacunae]
MAIRIIDHGSKEYQQMINLRHMVLRKPLGLDFSTEELAKEKDDILIGCFDEDKMEGCCLLTDSGNKIIRLRQMAVLSGLQGKGLGRVLMQYAENIARDRGYQKLSMHARKTAVGFYEKLGYRITGDEFTEVTIPHFEMEKVL